MIVSPGVSRICFLLLRPFIVTARKYCTGFKVVYECVEGLERLDQ